MEGKFLQLRVEYVFDFVKEVIFETIFWIVVTRNQVPDRAFH